MNPNDKLPDPEKVGKEYRKTATIRAVQMEADFVVVTKEGILNGNAGDWLAKGIEGEYWPIADSVFKKTYVPA